MRPIRPLRDLVLACCAGCLSVLSVAIWPVSAQISDPPVREGRSALQPGNRSAWLERVEQARARYLAFATQGRLSIHQKTIEPRPSTPLARPSTGFLDDATLRRGDVVVTPAGLMVFRGSARFPFSYDDFDSVGSPAAVGARHGPELIELQRVHDINK